MPRHQPTVASLRLDAQLAYLDGRVKRARDLNKHADVQAAIDRALGDLGVAHLRGADEDRIAALKARVRHAESRAARYLAA